MGHSLLEILKGHMAHHGYLTVAVALLLENAGLPVPGETILLLASFFAYSEHQLSLPLIIVTGVIAATLGDNIGFTIGHYGGRPLLVRYQHWFRISDSVILRGALHLWFAGGGRAAGRSLGHELGPICPVQLPRSGALGYRDCLGGLPLRQPMGKAVDGHGTRQRCHLCSSRPGGSCRLVAPWAGR